MTCDLCRRPGARLTGALCSPCAVELGAEREALAVGLLARLDLSRPEDRETWAALAEALVFRRLLPGAAEALERIGAGRPVRGPAGKPRPKGRR